jgi:hypothetical protein
MKIGTLVRDTTTGAEGVVTAARHRDGDWKLEFVKVGRMWINPKFLEVVK